MIKIATFGPKYPRFTVPKVQLCNTIFKFLTYKLDKWQIIALPGTGENWPKK